MLEASLRSLASASPALQGLLRPVVRLFALHRLRLDLGWFLTAELLPLGAGKAVPAEVRRLCDQLAPQYQVLIDSFAIPAHLVAAPIAADWVKFNAVDNRGEVLGIQF